MRVRVTLGSAFTLVPWMPRFRLLDETGEDLGPFATSSRNWKPGDVIPRGIRGNLEVVRVVGAEPGDEIDGYLIVKPV